MQLCLLSVLAVVLMVASCVEAASLRFQELRAIDRLCQSAQSRSVDAKEFVTVATSETVVPLQTLVGRCDPEEDCCYDSSVRRAVESDTRAVVFEIKNAVTNDQRLVTVNVEHHLKCGCVDVAQGALITNHIAE